MTRLQIRGADDPDGPLELHENAEGDLILSDREVNYLSLGAGENALLVAKCVEVMSETDYSEVREVEDRLRALFEDDADEEQSTTDADADIPNA